MEPPLKSCRLRAGYNCSAGSPERRGQKNCEGSPRKNACTPRAGWRTAASGGSSRAVLTRPSHHGPVRGAALSSLRRPPVGAPRQFAPPLVHRRGPHPDPPVHTLRGCTVCMTTLRVCCRYMAYLASPIHNHATAGELNIFNFEACSAAPHTVGVATVSHSVHFPLHSISSALPIPCTLGVHRNTAWTRPGSSAASPSPSSPSSSRCSSPSHTPSSSAVRTQTHTRVTRPVPHTPCTLHRAVAPRPRICGVPHSQEGRAARGHVEGLRRRLRGLALPRLPRLRRLRSLRQVGTRGPEMPVGGPR